MKDKIVNPGVHIPDLVGDIPVPSYSTSPAGGRKLTYSDIFNSLIAQGDMSGARGFPVVNMSEIPNPRRYPTYYPGMDNEEVYAQAQSGWEKAKNGIINFAGIATSTFLTGTVGAIYGAIDSANTGKFSDYYRNPINEELNEWTERLYDKYAFYKTQREREGHWWEPANLFTGNFLWDNIIRNLGFSVGTLAGGFAWGAALKALKVTSALTSMGAKMASKADDLIGNASKLPGAERMATINTGLNGLMSEARTLVGKGLMNSDRAIVALTGTLGESGIEALYAVKEFRERMINDYIELHGYSPRGEDLAEIDEYVDRVGNTVFGANAAVLSLSNYIQIPKIVSSTFKGEKAMLNDLAFKGGKYVSTLPEKGFGKLLYKTGKVGSLFFNTTEGLEEGAQYAIETGTQNFFGKKYRGLQPSAMDDGILHGIREALTTDEGLLNIFTGAFAGALQTSGFIGIRDGKPAIGKTGKIGERGITGYGGEKGRLREEALGALNKTLIRDNLREAYSTIKAAEILQQQREAAIARGDILESKDLEFDYAHNFIATRIRFRTKEAITQELDALRQEASTTEGFARLQQDGIVSPMDNQETFIRRLNGIQEQANKVEELYNTANIKYKGVVDPETGQRKYSDHVIDKLVYAAAKINDYDLRIPQISQNLIASGIDTTEVLSSILIDNKPNAEATQRALEDIEKLNVISDKKEELKQELADIIELSLRRNNFLAEYKDITQNPSQYDVTNWDELFGMSSEMPVEIDQFDEKGEKRKLDIGKEYSLDEVWRREGNKMYLSPKLTVLSQTLGGEYEVRLPNGTIKFMKPKELAKYKISDIDNTSQKLSELLDQVVDDVLARPEFESLGKAPSENKMTFINSLDNKELIDAIETEFNKRIKILTDISDNKDNLDRDQNDIENNSGDPTNPEGDSDYQKEPRLKAIKKLFTSTMTQSEGSLDEGWEMDPSKQPAHIRKSFIFFNRAKNSKNRQNFRAVIVTPSQLKEWNLEGMAKLSYNLPLDADISTIPGVTYNPNMTKEEAEKWFFSMFMASVFVEQSGNKLYYIDENGNRVLVNGKPVQFGRPIDPNLIVFQTMPTPAIYNSKNRPRFRSQDEKVAPLYAKAWEQKRVELFNKSASEIRPYAFDISGGIPILNFKQRNHVGDLLVPEKDIKNIEGLISVSTTGTVVVDGENFPVTKGVVMLTHHETVQVLNAAKFGEKKAKNIFDVIKALADDIIMKGTINPAYATYLQNVLYWRKGTSSAANQIFVDAAKAEISIGGKKFSITDIERHESEIIDILKNAHHNVNNKTLKGRFNESFIEYEEGLKPVVWKNYQAYLLSSKTRDGKTDRTIDETPLGTFVVKPTDGVPYAFKQKYATLYDLDLPVIIPQRDDTQEPPPAPPTKATTVKVGDYILDGETLNEFAVNKGKIKFKGEVTDGKVRIFGMQGEFDPVLKAYSEDVVAFEQILKTLVTLTDGKYDTGKDPIIVVQEFFIGKVTNDIQKIYDEQNKNEPPAPPVPPSPPPAPPVNPDGDPDIITEGPTEGDTPDYRRALQDEGQKERITSEDIEIFKKWAEENVPGIPYEILERMIETYDNQEAWGAFEKGVMKFYKKSIRGTEYHEAFEAIWKVFLSPEEKQAVVEEFRDRKGTFTDRNTGKKLMFHEATDQQAKEQLADDFADYRLGKLPARTLGEKIVRFFKQIIQFFKKFVMKPSLKEQLFDAIDKGRFRESKIPEWTKLGITQEAYNLVDQDINEFENTVIRYVEHIDYHTDGRRIGARSIKEKGARRIEIVKDVLQEIYDEKRWTRPATSEPLPEDTFSSLEDFTLFVLLHEKAHEYILREPGENKVSYETRVNNEALRRLTSEFREQPEYRRRLKNITEKQAQLFVDDMTIRISFIMIGEEKQSIFHIDSANTERLFERVKELYVKEKKYAYMGEETWQVLVKRTKERLRTMGLIYDEGSLANMNESSTNNKDYTPDTFSLDVRKTAPFGVKLMLMTLPKTKPINQENSLTLTNPPVEISKNNVNGYISVNFSTVFSTLMNKLANNTRLNTFEQQLIELAKIDADYVRVFTRLGGNLKDGQFDYSKFGFNEWRLFIQFYDVFTKQKPEAIIQYISRGESYLGRSTENVGIKERIDAWIENLKLMSEDPNSVISWNRQKKIYRYKRNSNFPKSTPETAEDAINFLESIGIDFSIDAFNRLKSTRTYRGRANERKDFFTAVSGIYQHIQDVGEIISLDGKSLGIDGHIRTLAELWLIAANPLQDNTRFDLKGNRIQNFTNNNYISIFENDFNSSETLDELKERRPELNDTFSANSQILKPGGLFFNENGELIRSLKTVIIEGMYNRDNEKGSKVTELGYGDRLSTEINMNLKGIYHVLVPADSRTEWAVTLGNQVSFNEIVAGQVGWDKISEIFYGYLIDDINLALDYNNREKLNAVKGRGRDLRFFEGFLSEVKDGKLVQSDLLVNLNKLIHAKQTKNKKDNILKFVEKNRKEIDERIRSYILDTVEKTRSDLRQNHKLIPVSKKTGEVAFYTYPSLLDEFAKDAHINKFDMTEEQINNVLLFTNANYIINNIEMHKIYFGDPYQFAENEETKRIKSFLSPRRITFSSPEFNTFLTTKYNKAGDIELTENELGYHEFGSDVSTVTMRDVRTYTDNYTNQKEADGASWLMDTSYRSIKIRNAQWDDKAEAWFQWQMAYTRQHMPGYKYNDMALKAADLELIKKPEPKHKIEVLKPIVSGIKANVNNIEINLDKFSQMPLFYKAAEERGLAWLYEKMFREKIGYTIMLSGRKVGATDLYDPYVPDSDTGKWKPNPQPFTGIVKIPWKSYGIQVETSHEGDVDQIRGSQLTKLASLDLFEFGKPIGETEERRTVVQKAYDRNVKALRMLHDNAYNEVLDRLGIEDLGTSYRLKEEDGPAIIQKTLEGELLRRELSENVKDTIQLNDDGQFRMLFEASTSYRQIRDIIYSIVHKTVIAPRVNGGPKVQVPVTMWENLSEGRRMVIKENGRYRELKPGEHDKLSNTQKKEVRFTSDTLKFYTREEPYMEIMLPNSFREKFDRKKFPDDESILKYLNNTEEGRRILSGVAFRIPTQAMASIEVFRVKGFLPKFMGDTVVVPTDIVGKTNSDFDIDKLNIYFKSIYIDANRNIRLVELKGDEEQTKAFYGDVYSETIGNQIRQIEKYKEFRDNLLDIFGKLEAPLQESYRPGSIMFDDIMGMSPEQLEFYDFHSELIDEIVEQADEEGKLPSEYMMEQIDRLSMEESNLFGRLLDDVIRDRYIKKMYKKALENEYFESLEELITLPENFDRLLRPVDDGGLKKLAKRLDDLRGINEGLIRNKLLDRNHMSRLRHSFISANRWVGIAAVNITGHSLAQKTVVYVDPGRIKRLSNFEKGILGDGQLNIPHNVVNIGGTDYVSLSGTKTYDGKAYISDRLSGYITSFVDVANDPYINSIIASDAAVGTFMFLERIGAGEAGVMFMNQPIIREYLTYLSNIGVKGLHSKANIEYIRKAFGGSVVGKVAFDVDNFGANIEAYYKHGELSKTQLAEQQSILDEFLKIAKMAHYNFKLSQAINYDTTKFRSGDSLVRKQYRTDVATTSNIFANIEGMLENSFIGHQSIILDKVMDSMSAVFRLEETQFRSIIDEALRPYIEDEYLSNDDFDRIANRLRASLLDYVVITKSGLGDRIIELLINPDTAVANQLEAMRKKHPNIAILSNLVAQSSDRGGPEASTKTVRLAVNTRNPNDENLLTEMMRELKEVEPEFYERLIDVAILQGSYQSDISIKNIIDVDDYAERVDKLIRSVITPDEIKYFVKEKLFERNNFRNEDIVPTYKPYAKIELDNTGAEIMRFDEYGEEIYSYKLPAFYSRILKNMNIEPGKRQLLFISEEYNGNIVNYDVIKVPRLITTKSGDQIDIVTGESVTSSMIAQRLSQGDYSYYKYYGYKKIRYSDGSPVITVDGDHVYKLVNLYGDGKYASEYYTELKPSVLANSTVRVEKEIEDNEVIKYFVGDNQQLDKGGEISFLPMQPVNIRRIINGTKTITSRTDRFADGDYLMEDGTSVTLTYMGTYRVLDDTELLNVDDNTTMSTDEFAVEEGFENWQDFVKNAKFSDKFIQGKQMKYLYRVELTKKDKEPLQVTPTSKTSKVLQNLENFNNSMKPLVELLDLGDANIKKLFEWYYEDTGNEIYLQTLSEQTEEIEYYIEDTSDITEFISVSTDYINSGENFNQEVYAAEYETVGFLLYNKQKDTIDFIDDINDLMKILTPYIIRIRPTYFDKSQLEIPFDENINTQQDRRGVKEGVDFVFEQNPELANIGTQEQYSQYLDTIFPDSKVKGIVWRGGDIGNIINKEEGSYFTGQRRLAENYAKGTIGHNRIIRYDNWVERLHAAVLDIKNPQLGGLGGYSKVSIATNKDSALNLDMFEVSDVLENKLGLTPLNRTIDDILNNLSLFNSKLINEITTKSSSQIHILGSKQDIEGFRNFVKGKVEANQEGVIEENFSEFGTEYKFVMINGVLKEGYYRQKGKDWQPLNKKKVNSKYEELKKGKTESQGKQPLPPPAKPTILGSRNVMLDYTSGQEKALLDIQELIDQGKGYYLLAGYAGTGKTTMIENIVRYGLSNNMDIVIMAPTNKAVKVVNEKNKMVKLNVRGTTIHRAIYGEPDPLTGEWVPKTKIKDSVVVVDEASLIDEPLMKDLLDNTIYGNVVILMGDRFQLEPISKDPKLFDGGVREFATSKTELTEVKRQAMDSNVLKVATLMRMDNKPYVPSESVQDFQVIGWRTDFINAFRESVRNNEDSVMIVATNTERMSMNNIARLEKFGKDRGILEPGEVIASVANSSSFANGEIFTADQIVDMSEPYPLTFAFDGKTLKFDAYIARVVSDSTGGYSNMLFFPGLSRPSLYHSQILESVKASNPELYDILDNSGFININKRGVEKLSPSIVIGTYGYATTAHKSQGSQWDKVFVYQNYVAPSWNPARWLYTAITRSSREVVLLPTSSNVKLSPQEMNERTNRMATPDVEANKMPDQGQEALGEREELQVFYDGLTSEQRGKLGNIDQLWDEYQNVPFTYTMEDFTNNLKCRL